MCRLFVPPERIVPVPSRRLSILVAALAAAAALVAGLVVALRPSSDRGGCPAGYAPLAGEQAREVAERGRTICLKQGTRLPETYADLARANAATGQRLGL